jgi:CheY-like chemotaxis protein
MVPPRKHMILIVDDNAEFLAALKKAVEKRDPSLEVIAAPDGFTALERLNEHPVSLVVSDIRMPKMGGFELLSRVAEQYPHVPVVLVTGFDESGQSEKSRIRGAFDYLTKPLSVAALLEVTARATRQTLFGGILQGIPISTVLQMVTMERKSCTLRVTEPGGGHHGVLFLRDGELLDARCGTDTGEAAAERILGWGETDVIYQPDCPSLERRIHSNLQALVLTALRRKQSASAGPSLPVPPREPGVGEPAWAPEFEERLALFREIGSAFSLGDFRLGYVGAAFGRGFLLFVGREGPPARIDLEPEAPRARVMESLLRQSLPLYTGK